MAIPPAFDEALTRDLWGSTGPVGPIATRITLACRGDLQARLCAALQLQPAASALADVPPSCTAWSGMVRASLAAGAQLLLDAAAVHQLPGLVPELARPAPAAVAGAPVAPIADALASVPFPLRVRLADCELDLASLQDLRVGDVVPLPHRLDAPLLVRDARQEVVFAGYLARRGRHKALELAAPATVAPQPH